MLISSTAAGVVCSGAEVAAVSAVEIYCVAAGIAVASASADDVGAADCAAVSSLLGLTIEVSKHLVYYEPIGDGPHHSLMRDSID